MRRLYLFSGLSRILFPASSFCYKSASRFVIGLSMLMSLGIVGSSIWEITIGGIDQSTYDFSMRIRLSSPAPSEQIVILDIDERSLAMLAPIYGRWPWKREVMAQVIAELEAYDARGILLNVLFSDPDISNEHSDAILNEIAAESSIVAYPLIRLPIENDAQSELFVSKIPGASIKKNHKDKTIAAVLPFMPGMHANMGISNLAGDNDGIIRRFKIVWEEDSWEMPTLIERTIMLADVKPLVDSRSPFLINWRNKKGTYQRISFSDYFLSLEGENFVDPVFFKNKIVIIGVSAPGISNIKATAASPVTDDNEILATILDDVINNTHLRSIPSIFIAVTSLLCVWGMAILFIHEKFSCKELDLQFVAFEIFTLCVMYIMISFTNYYIDITPLATFLLVFYTISRMHQILSDRVLKGAPEQLEYLRNSDKKWIGVFAFKYTNSQPKQIKSAILKLENEFGYQRVFFTFDVLGGNHLIGALGDTGCVIIIAPQTINEASLLYKMKTEFSFVKVQDYKSHVFVVPDHIANNYEKFSRFISLKVISVISMMPV